MSLPLPEVNDRAIVECVMNVSEGRDDEKLRAIAGAMASVPCVYLLNLSADPDHHRAVLTFMGAPDSIGDAAFAAAQRAVELVDLRIHRGAHPRIGAVDVVPFVPLQNVTMKECVKIARALGRKVVRDLGVPVYLYERAALRPDRRHLSDIRRGGFEALLQEVQTEPARAPDLGPLRLHPSAGAMAVGARDILIAFNVFLDTSDLMLARQIARAVREREGGLPGIRALGLYLERRGQAQVSLNVTDYRRTSLLEVFERISALAGSLGAHVTSSEIVGLSPQDALRDSTPAKIKLENFSDDLILEKRIRDVLVHRRGAGDAEVS